MWCTCKYIRWAIHSIKWYDCTCKHRKTHGDKMTVRTSWRLTVACQWASLGAARSQMKDLARFLNLLMLSLCRARPGSEFQAVTARYGNDLFTISNRGCLGVLVCRTVPSSVALVDRWDTSDLRLTRSLIARGPSVSWMARCILTSDATFRKFPNQNQTDTDWMPIWKTKYQTDFIWASNSRHLYQIFKKVNIYAYKGIL